MKKNLFLLTALFIAFLLAGCQDEIIVQEYKSPGEKIGEEIMVLAKSLKTNRVQLRNTAYKTEIFKFEIKGEIMSVYVHNNDIEHYNLNYVQRYSLVGGYNEGYIFIWFINPQNPLNIN